MDLKGLDLLSRLRRWKQRRWPSPALPSDYRQGVGQEPCRGPGEMRRYGTEYGGWWLPLDLRLPAGPVVYAVGAGEDLSFEAAFTAANGGDVRVVDPTPRAQRHFAELSAAVAGGRPFPIQGNPETPYDISPGQLARMRYHAFGVADRDGDRRFYFPPNQAHVSCTIDGGQGNYFTARCLTVPSLMRELGHGSVDILKLDIEGAEYGVLERLSPAGPLPRYLCVEFHVPDQAALRRLRRVHRRMGKIGYRFAFSERFDVLFERVG